jgi:MiaB/RimO family radical SAM methylthiotransferase
MKHKGYSTFAIFQNGCESLLYDMEDVKSTLSDRCGLDFVELYEAELVIFMGCTFSAQKENETIELIDSLLNSKAKQIWVSGCYLREYSNHPRVQFIKPLNIKSFILNYLSSSGAGVETDSSKFSPVVAISRGCYGSCTYCSIRTIKGHHQSRRVDDILKDIERRITNNLSIKLVGEDVAGYGLDRGLDLRKLVDRIIAAYPNIKLQFGSLNPQLLKRFSTHELAVFAYPNVGGNIHVPIQSASDRILGLMKRGYTCSEFGQVYGALKQAGVQFISTDLICGFPTETPDDHKENIAFLNEFDFQYAQIFSYQERPGTPATQLEQVDEETRKYRTLELITHFLSQYKSNNGIDYDQLVNRGQRNFNTNINF